MGQMDEQNIWEEVSDSKCGEYNAECESPPEVSSLKLPYEMDIDDAVVEATVDKECAGQTGSN